MKKLIFALAGLLTFGAAHAQSVDFSQTKWSGDVDAVSRYDYRGQQYSNDASLGAGLKLQDIGYSGLYLRGHFDKVGDTIPFNAQTRVRSDLGVGYEWTAVDSLWKFDVSANHVYNAPERLSVDRKTGRVQFGSYSEARARVSYDIAFVEVGQGFGPVKDTYVSAGVAVPVTDEFKVGAAVSGYHYHGTTGNEYNNTEVFASYDFYRNWQLYGKYSFGGHGYDRSARQSDLADYGTVGVRFLF